MTLEAKGREAVPATHGGDNVRERPIIFSVRMVCAILEGRKTQTRRALNPQPPEGAKVWHNLDTRGFDVGRCSPWYSIWCPYGQVGDRLWVKEPWYPAFRRTPTNNGCIYKADYGHRIDLVSDWSPNGHGRGWKNSMFMPRSASRLTLEITNIRVQRLQEISEEDAATEGTSSGPGLPAGGSVGLATARYWFHDLWDSLNAKRGFDWRKNPWVWVIEFHRIQKYRH